MSHGSRVSALGLVGWLRQWCFFLEQSLFVLTIDEPAAFAFSPCLVAEVCEPWQWRLEELTSPGITINTLRRWCPQSMGPRCAGSSLEVTTAYCVVNNGRLR